MSDISDNINELKLLINITLTVKYSIISYVDDINRYLTEIIWSLNRLLNTDSSVIKPDPIYNIFFAIPLILEKAFRIIFKSTHNVSKLVDSRFTNSEAIFYISWSPTCDISAFSYEFMHITVSTKVLSWEISTLLLIIIHPTTENSSISYSLHLLQQSLNYITINKIFLSNRSLTTFLFHSTLS